MTKAEVERTFTYHAPTPEMQTHLIAVREAGKQLALAILNHTPSGPDQSAAIRKVREAVMTANAAIVLDF